MIKSAQHDATPSWNGFNYQGKVGIYVCLKMIFDELENHEKNKHGKDSEDFTEFIESHFIQYEWIEDFSILKNDQYISHHQVKHKVETGFSTHVEALVTILNRTQKILSTANLARYLNLNKNSEEGKIQALKEMQALNSDGSLNPDWRTLPDIEESEFYTCLNEFDQFSVNAFDQSLIYFHTSEAVSEPGYQGGKHIAGYMDIPPHLKETLKGKETLKSLEDLKIYIGEDKEHPYRLVLSDDNLENEIQSLIDNLLSQIHKPADYQSFTVDDKAIYVSALLREIDTHIGYRHSVFHHLENTDRGFLATRPKIGFNDLFEILEKTFKEQNEEYWEIYCQQGFELAYKKQWQALNEEKRDFPESTSVLEIYQRNLENFRLYFLPKFYDRNYKGLLKKLSPQFFKKELESPSIFYREISNTDRIQNVFLEFIQDINIINNEDKLSYQSTNQKLYFPSAVSLEHGRENQQKSCIETFRKKMANLPYKPTHYLKHADYYVTTARNPEDIDDKDFHLNSITELNENQLSILPSNKHRKSKSSQNTISARKELKFRHYETAIKELKDE